jgi:GAF domain-containing protein
MVMLILGLLGLVSWLSSQTLENAFKEARRNAMDLAQTNYKLEANQVLLQARTRELERESAYQAASAEVGRAATSILRTEDLMEQVVELIRERFDLYYVGLFLVDESGKWAILQAGTGEAGRAMLARGHQLQVGRGSMIGWSIAHSQARVAQEAVQDAERLASAELPDTRAEAALPLRSRGRVIGAMTVQSVHPGIFDRDTTTVLQTMADQVAVAIDNARLFAESEEALQATRRAYSELTRQAWTEMLRAQPDLSVLRDRRGVSSAGDVRRPETQTALQTGQLTVGDSDRATLAAPIKIRGQVIGVMDARKPAGTWRPEEISLIETLTEQLGVALESARLHQDTQRRAARERVLREISDRLQRAADMEALMRMAAEELNKALGASRAYVRLGTEALQPQNGGEQTGEGDR